MEMPDYKRRFTKHLATKKIKISKQNSYKRKHKPVIPEQISIKTEDILTKF
jgi:L-rhamnose mutarotase